MVTYPYEDLGPERFQEFCQSLIVQQNPRAQCLPVGMPDGGRDAVVSHRATDTLAFQVKFRRKTPLADATSAEYLSWLQGAVTNELPNILRLIGKGVGHYILISNIPCTSHAGVGTRDKMLDWLAARLPEPIEIDVWWRDDLDRRLDPNWELKRTFGLTNSAASADALLARMTGDPSADNARFLTIRKFIRSQFDRDATIRFREADLRDQPLLPNYLDIGARTQLADAEQSRFVAGERTLRQTPVDAASPDYYRSREYTAASLLLQLAGTRLLTRTVVEGAPGQGKSTLVQYLCQVHRARLLGKDVRSVPVEYRTSPILLPLRTDLRDLDMWIRNENPFAGDKSVESYPRSVEGFLAAMVHVLSGGGTFTVDDLDEIIAAAPVLLAFDGLDEVADIEARTRIVGELVDCAGRLQEIGREVRFVVTSRPSAFAAAPRFPAERFSYISLTNLSYPLIMEYTKTWMKTRKVEIEEARKLTATLSDKLREPHIAELAHNSMQLAILLWLIYQQQGNLPEQRTSLYEQYIKTFLTREAGKSRVIREHGGTILQLHGYLAWVLHARAEAGRSQGNIGEDELKAILRQYLHEVGYSHLDIIDELFQGMAERFIALVSRVQGTWEFEVQPLREYFAAYHLYDTARMSRAGREVTGTKADRFDAMAANPYWLNVTRFYVGFFDKGELAYLLHQFGVTFSEGIYSSQTYARSLANSIVADQVFVQSPAMGRELSELIARDVIGWFALARGDGTTVLRLPNETGGAEIVRRAKGVLLQGQVSYASQVAQVLWFLDNQRDLIQWWHENLPERTSDRWFRWMLVGTRLDVLRGLNSAKLLGIFTKQKCDTLDYGLLFRGGATAVGVESAECGLRMLDFVKAGISQPTRLAGRPNILDLTVMLFFEGMYGVLGEPTITATLKEASSAEHFRALRKMLNDFLRREHGYRYQPVLDAEAPRVVEEYFGPCWLATRMIVLRFLVTGARPTDDVSCNLFDIGQPLPVRLSVAAGRRSDSLWWEDSIASCSEANDAQLLVTALICLADEDVISRCLPLLDDLVRGWTPEQVVGTLDTIAMADGRQRRLNARQISMVDIDSAVLLAAVSIRSRLDQKQRLLSAAVAASSDERLRLMHTEHLLRVCTQRIAHAGRWAGARDAIREYGATLAADWYGTPLRLLREPYPVRVLDETIASEVLRAPERYPPDLVTLAD